jgi:hypothetical protein
VRRGRTMSESNRQQAIELTERQRQQIRDEKERRACERSLLAFTHAGWRWAGEPGSSSITGTSNVCASIWKRWPTGKSSDLQILRRYRRPLLLRLEHSHRSAMEGRVHRAPRLGHRRLVNVRIGIISQSAMRCERRNCHLTKRVECALFEFFD